MLLKLLNMSKVAPVALLHPICFCSDIMKIRAGLGARLAILVQWISTFFSGFIVAFVTNWELTLFMVFLAPFIVATGTISAKVSAQNS